MPKKTIAADELIFLFREEMETTYETRHMPSVAIIPDPDRGWTALTSHRDKRRYPHLEEQIAKIETALRRRFDLIES